MRSAVHGSAAAFLLLSGCETYCPLFGCLGPTLAIALHGELPEAPWSITVTDGEFVRTCAADVDDVVECDMGLTLRERGSILDLRWDPSDDRAPIVHVLVTTDDAVLLDDTAPVYWPFSTVREECAQECPDNGGSAELAF